MSSIRTDRTDFATDMLNTWGRLRVGAPMDVLNADSVLKYGIEPGYQSTTSGTASETFLPDQSSYELSVGTASGDKIFRQTSRSQNYNPGRGTFVVQTGTLGPQKAGVVSRIGFFNDENGLFFQRDENELSVVIRSNVTGTPTDGPTAQSQWNVDRLDGSGPSGIVLNPDMMQMFVLDFQWLGSGIVRFGFHIDGQFVLTHVESNANNSSEPYMSRASLPLRFELENIASTSSSSSMKMTGCAMIADGEAEGRITYPHSTNTGFTSIAAPQGTWTPLQSFRMKDTINGVSVSGYSVLRELNVLNDADTIAIFQIVRNSTLTGASFSDHSSESMVQTDSAATDSTGGFVGFQSYLTGVGQTNAIGVVEDAQQRDLILYPGDTYTIRARSLSATDAALYMSTNWFEIY